MYNKKERVILITLNGNIAKSTQIRMPMKKFIFTLLLFAFAAFATVGIYDDVSPLQEETYVVIDEDSFENQDFLEIAWQDVDPDLTGFGELVILEERAGSFYFEKLTSYLPVQDVSQEVTFNLVNTMGRYSDKIPNQPEGLSYFNQHQGKLSSFRFS